MDSKREGGIQRPVSPWVAVIVILICIGLALLIYHFTVGRKTSIEAPPDAQVSPLPIDPSLEETGSDRPGASHAVPVDEGEVKTKPATEKQPLPPVESGG
jgi:hypothetical protein